MVPLTSEKIFGLAPIIDDQAKILILGSMPGKESLKKEQYDANKRNQMWKIMENTLKLQLPEEYPKRINVLRKHHIALWDVIHSCKRVGSLDSAITEDVPNDFGSFFKEYSSLKIVGFNGNKAYQTFKSKIGFQDFPEIQFIKLPSTSPIPGKNVKSFEEKVVEWSKVVNSL